MGDWRIPEGLGYLAIYSTGSGISARRHFARAIELEATNPGSNVYYDYSRLLLNAEAAKAALHKAIVLKPDYDGTHTNGWAPSCYKKASTEWPCLS